MTDHNHLSQQDLTTQMIDPQSLSKKQLRHLQHCTLCQKENDVFTEAVQQTQKELGQNQNRKYHSRRSFYQRIETEQVNQFSKNKRLLIGATICLLSIFLLLPLLNQPPEQTPSSLNNMATHKADPSLVEFATAITPDGELMEPELLTLILPEESDLTDNSFEDFILFISSPAPEAS